MLNNLKKFENLVGEIKFSFEAEKSKIQRQTQWTESAKAEAMETLTKKTQAGLDDLKRQLRQEKDVRRKQLEQKLFALDDPAHALGYRDAISRSEAISTDSVKLQDLMTQSLETGDFTLAKGVAFVAIKSGYFEIAAQGFSGAAAGHFEEYLDLQSGAVDPLNRRSFEESLLWNSVI